MPLFDKNIWKKAVQQYLYSNHPGLVPQLTSKIIDATCHTRYTLDGKVGSIPRHSRLHLE